MRNMNVKKCSFVLILFFLSLSCMANSIEKMQIINDSIDQVTKDTIIDTTKVNSKEDTIEHETVNKEDNSVIEAMSITIRELNSKNDQLEKQVKLLEKDKENELNQIRKLKKEVQDRDRQSDSLKDSVLSLQNKLSKVESNYKELAQQVSKISDVIAKQCLLYPLEGKYSPTFIKEAIQTISAIDFLYENINEKPSKEYEDTKATYFSLLEDYKRYNDEILKFVKERICGEGEMIGWNFGPNGKKDLNNELERLTYVQDCYNVRNDPPYKSIIYLDNMIDRIKSALSKKGNIKDDINQIIKDLTPNK